MVRQSERGLLSSFLSCEFEIFPALASLPNLYTQYRNTGSIWKGKIMNKRNRKCISVPRYWKQIFRKEQVTRGHALRMEGKQEMGNNMSKDVTSTVRWPKHGHSSPATQPPVKLKRVKSPDVFTHPRSWEPIWTYAWKGRQGRVLFFHNSLLHSNIKSTPSPPGWEAEAFVFN